MSVGAAPPRASRRARLDRVEAAALAALFALSMVVLAGLLLRVWTRGGIVTGGDGYLVVDQLQYLNWLRQAGERVAAENLYDLEDGPASFVHPALLVSGLLHAAGLGLFASYLVWKPVAVAALFLGALLYSRRFLRPGRDRWLALVVALFAASPVSALVGWTGLGDAQTKFHFDFVGGELWAGTYLWGYYLTGVAVGLLPLGLLAYERARAAAERRRLMLGLAAAAGLAVAWLQPWQGATFVLVLAGAEALQWRREERAPAGAEGPRRRRTALTGAALRLAPVAGATALPLAYYWVLSRVDPSWALAGAANDFPRWPWWVTVVGLLPLGLLAPLAYRLPAPDFGAVALRLWPLAALAVFYQPFGTFPFHAFQGLALPLAVLGVIAVRARLGERPLPLVPALAFAALLIVPGTVYRLLEVRDAVAKGRQPHFLTVDEHDALRHLDALEEEGGVLAPVYSGLLIPAYTGRETWVGAGSWSPDFQRRSVLAERLFDGELRARAAAAVIRDSGARFLFSDCHGRADVERLVAALTEPPRRFGCATVYRVR